MDAYFGNQLPFNKAVFDRTLVYRTKDTIRAAAVNYSEATNPDFGLSELAPGFSMGESVALILVFGNVTTGVVDTSPVVYWFGKPETCSPAIVCN